MKCPKLYLKALEEKPQDATRHYSVVHARTGEEEAAATCAWPSVLTLPSIPKPSTIWNSGTTKKGRPIFGGDSGEIKVRQRQDYGRLNKGLVDW